jgi:membrane-associated phospholipid phosphatase
LKLHRLAYLISVILHPLLLPTGCLFVFLYITPLKIIIINDSAKPWLLLMVFVLTFLAPITCILLYFVNGSMEALEMKKREDRFFPFAITTCLYAVATGLLSYGNVFEMMPVLPLMIGSITATLAIVTSITLFWKISAHSAGICGVLGFMVSISYKYAEKDLLTPIVVTVLLAGCLMSARLYLNAHSPRQILAGAWLGFTINFSAIQFLL